MLKIANKVFLLTGATGNLGSAILSKFFSQSNRFVLPQRSPGKLQAKHPFIAQNPSQFLIADVTNPEEAELSTLLPVQGCAA